MNSTGLKVLCCCGMILPMMMLLGKTVMELYAKSPTEWSLLKNTFVSATDAVGAVAGNFIGSYIIVSVPVYIPAGLKVLQPVWRPVFYSGKNGWVVIKR